MSDPVSNHIATRDDIERIEGQLRLIIEALERLIRLEERQAVHADRIGKLEESLGKQAAKIDDNKVKLDAWVNRGVGAWAVTAGFLAIFEFFFRR